ncbi:MAG: copper-binding protein [Deltaproteobacteria bacterium]|jgi:Cu/Ag efflux protein CusF|nr:copper-binding protein [Deltaproteobacteria bacterium]
MKALLTSINLTLASFLAILAIFIMAPYSLAQHAGHDHGSSGHGGHGGHSASQPQTPEASPKSSALHSTQGTIKELEPQNLRLVIDHAPVPSLNWPAMVMGFKVEKAESLSDLKVGDQVEFDFKQVGSDYIIVNLDKQ